MKPKLGFITAGKNGYRVANFVSKYGYPIEFIATCHSDYSEYENKIAKICQDRNIELHRKVNANNPNFIDIIKAHSIDLMILAWYPDIIKPKAIKAAKIGWINMHPSLLPYGRGKYPYFWAIKERTPFGVSLHFVDKGVDSGDVLFQKQIEYDITDTGETLFKKGYDECFKLFKESYPKIIKGDLHPDKQLTALLNLHEQHPCVRSPPYHHAAKILDGVTEINLDMRYNARDLIDLIRGRTFINSKTGTFFILDGKKYIIKTIITESDDGVKHAAR